MSAQSSNTQLANQKLINHVIDRVGAGLSFACALHCLLLPFVIGILPLIGLSVLADHNFEAIFASCTICLALLSTLMGIRTHQNRRLFLLFLFSAGTIALGVFFVPHEQHLAFVVVGGLGITATHIINYKLCDSCPSCHGHKCC